MFFATAVALENGDDSLVDKLVPLSTLQAGSIEELCAAVRDAASQDFAVYPLGGRTMMDQGFLPARSGVNVDLRALTRIIDYPARDMTITVQAGFTLATLQATLATENQRLPIDVPFPEQATLGGAIATNTSGPRRYGFGTFRDYVIGMTTINDEGKETKAGGRVVKNVAGYDLCKLHIGALGTLGIISQVTLKVKPRPEQQAMLLLGCEEAALSGLLDELHRSRTQPVCIEALNARCARHINQNLKLNLPSDPWVLAIGFEHASETVDWQLDQLGKELALQTLGKPIAVKAAEANPIWNALTENRAHSEASVVFKANVLPSATADFCRWLNAQSIQPSLQAHAGNGIVTGRLAAGLELEPVQRFLQEALKIAQAVKGNIVLLRCPAAWKRTLPVWGAPRPDGWLMRAVKNKLDPRGIFNPGRFVEGI